MIRVTPCSATAPAMSPSSAMSPTHERNIAEALVREELPQARRAGGEIERDAAVAALDEVLHDPRADAALAAGDEKGLLGHAGQE